MIARRCSVFLHPIAIGRAEKGRKLWEKEKELPILLSSESVSHGAIPEGSQLDCSLYCIG